MGLLLHECKSIPLVEDGAPVHDTGPVVVLQSRLGLEQPLVAGLAHLGLEEVLEVVRLHLLGKETTKKIFSVCPVLRV